MSGHSFWLIERGQAQQQEPTLWWEGQSGDWTQHKWTHKAIEAFRFPTREAAQAEIDKYESRRIGIGNLTVELGVPTEHVILPVETRGPDSRTQFSSCCARCGKPADIEVGPVNDVLNVHLVPQCDCIHVTYPSGFNLWWPITTTRNVRNVWTWRNDAEVQRQCELFYAKIREMVGDVDDLPTLYGVIDAAAAAALASRRAAPKPWGWAITLRSELGSWNEAVGTEEEAMIGRLYPANSQHGEARVVARARLYAGEVENADSTSAHSSRFGNDGSVVQLHGSVSRETTDAVGPTDKGVAESAPGAAPEREPTPLAENVPKCESCGHASYSVWHVEHCERGQKYLKHLASCAALEFGNSANNRITDNDVLQEVKDRAEKWVAAELAACGAAPAKEPSGEARSQRPATLEPSATPPDGLPPAARPAASPATERDGEGTLNGMAVKVALQNQKWWVRPDGTKITRNAGELMMLVVSEVVEGFEGERKNLMDDKLPHRRMAEVEIADAIVRLLDYSAARGYDLDGAMREKLAYNAKREDHKKESANIAQKNPLEFESVFDVALTAQSEAK